MENANRTPAAHGRESLPPDKYAADFIISYVAGIARPFLERIKSGDKLIACVYKNGEHQFCCPKNHHQQAPEGVQWFRMGKYRNRIVYTDNQHFFQNERTLLHDKL